MSTSLLFASSTCCISFFTRSFSDCASFLSCSVLNSNTSTLSTKPSHLPFNSSHFFLSSSNSFFIASPRWTSISNSATALLAFRSWFSQFTFSSLFFLASSSNSSSASLAFFRTSISSSECLFEFSNISLRVFITSSDS